MSNIIIGKTLLSSNTPKRGDKGILINKKYFIPFSSGSGNEFYKCTSVQTPQQVTFYRVSGAGVTECNGDYYDTNTTYENQAVYAYTNSSNNTTYYLYGFDGYWFLYTETTLNASYYYSDGIDSIPSGLPYEASNPSYGNPPTITQQSGEVGSKTWTGKKAVLNNGVYEYESDSTSDLEYSSITPVVGRVYNENALASISSLYTKIPESGLIFYTSCNNTCNNLINNSSPNSISAISYETIDGIPCIKINGDGSYVRYGSFQDAVGQNKPKSICCWVNIFKQNSTNQFPRFVNLYSANAEYRECGFEYSEGDRICGSWSSFGNYIQPVELDKWYFVCWTFDNNISKGYCKVDGELQYKGERTIDLSNNYCNNFGFNVMPGGYLWCYLSSVRVYNRALSEDEIILLSNEFLV